MTLALAALLAFGVFRGIKEVNQFRAYQDSLSPSEQLAFYDLPFWRQIQIYDAAQKLGISPKALEFYLDESARPGSPLAGLSIPEALRVSSLAEQTGKSGFLLDYVTKYGVDNTLKSITPEALSRYVDASKVPDSPLRDLTVQEGLQFASSAKMTTGSWLDAVPAKYKADVEPTFQGAPEAWELTEDVTVYRYWGRGSGETGSPWYSFDSSMSPVEAQSSLALPISNTATEVSTFVIPKGTTIVIGKAASQVATPKFGPYAIGGGIQIYLPDPSVAQLVASP